MRKLFSALVPCALLASVVMPSTASADPSTVALANNTPGLVAKAQNVGSADPNQVIDVTVWLALNKENQLLQDAQTVNVRGSANYHKFQSSSALQATYSPAGGNVNAVQHYIQNNGLSILYTAPNGYYVKAEGTVAQVSRAFHVSVNNYSYKGKVYRSNGADPQIDTSLKGVIAAVTGIDNVTGYQPNSVSLKSVATREGAVSSPLAYTPVCAPSGSWQSFSQLITYYASASSHTPLTTTLTPFIPCGYNARTLEKAYGVDAICSYTASGIDPSTNCGQGQTVVITDAYGSPTIQSDLAKYDQVNGLPPANLQIIENNGAANRPENKSQDPLGWQAEVTLDVENVHAIAPGATIVLIASPNNYADLDEALNEVVIHHYGNIVSSSWSTIEGLGNPARFQRDERILATGALEGIGFNFSSGDNGDESLTTSNPNFISVDYPASSVYATGIGGTSLFLKNDGSYLGESGWGNYEVRDFTCRDYSTSGGVRTCLDYNQTSPRQNVGFQFGAGGGCSQYFAKPSWQVGTGTAQCATRGVPDVSMLADPFTGSEIWITDGGVLQPEVYGGTSLASPLFSAVMALVDHNRSTPAGQAAPRMYPLLGSAALNEVSPSTNPHPCIPYSDTNCAVGGMYRGSGFSGSIFTITFDQDTSLTTNIGWDKVTGVGTPSVPSFVTAVAAQP